MKLKPTIPCLAAAFLLSGLSWASDKSGESDQSEPKINVVEIWSKHCASCHGKDGKGKTKAGEKAKVKDMTDAKYQESFTDAKAFKSISFGMKDDRGRDQMKPFESKLTDEEIKATIVHLRKYVKQ